MMNEVEPSPVTPPGEVVVAGATGDEAVTIQQFKVLVDSLAGSDGGSIQPIALQESGEINGWTFQLATGCAVYGWCTDKLCYISFALSDDTEPAPKSAESAIEPMAQFISYYYCCDIYPPGEPYHQTIVDGTVVTVGEKEKHDVNEFVGDQHCEWDSEYQRFRLYLTSGEPTSTSKYSWRPEVLLMCK